MSVRYSRLPRVPNQPQVKSSDSLTGASRKLQTLGAMIGSTMQRDGRTVFARKMTALAKNARDCTADEVAAMREGNRQHDERSVFDAGMSEAKRLGAEAQALGKPITSDPYDRDLFPLHSEAWCDSWMDEAQRRLTETDA